MQKSKYDFVKVKFNEIELKLMISERVATNDWVILIIPFGFELDTSMAFFDFFSSSFNIVTWESRFILGDTDKQYNLNELNINSHCDDLLNISKYLGIKKAHLVGYCSGAGIALKASSLYKKLFLTISLIHGEYVLLNSKDCVTDFALDVDGVLNYASQGIEQSQAIINKLNLYQPNIQNEFSFDISKPYKNPVFLHRYANNYINYKSVDFLTIAIKNKVPSLVLTGNKDIQCNLLSSEKINKLMKCSEIYVDKKADHYEVLRNESNTLVSIWNYLAQFYTMKNTYLSEIV